MLCFILLWFIISSYWVRVILIAISFWVASQASGQSQELSGNNEAILNRMGKIAVPQREPHIILSWCTVYTYCLGHDDVIKWKYFPRCWPFVRGIHRSPVNSPHKGQWRGALMFTLICDRINSWVNNREAGDLRRNRAHYDVIVIVMVR